MLFILRWFYLVQNLANSSNEFYTSGDADSLPFQDSPRIREIVICTQCNNVSLTSVLKEILWVGAVRVYSLPTQDGSYSAEYIFEVVTNRKNNSHIKRRFGMHVNFFTC